MMPRSARRLARVFPGLVALAAFLGLRATTDLNAPPRYDGAGYAVLASSILEGRGYRAIDHPDAPPHAHFPPGYPAALASLWAFTGPSVRAAHLASILCTALAAGLFARWLARLERFSIAGPLSLALAFNWSWLRIGGLIQSEPLFLLLSALALNAAEGLRPIREPNEGSEAESEGIATRAIFGRDIGLGLLLAACILTRHVGVCLALAVIADLFIQGRRRIAIATAIATLLPLVPWIAWQARVGRGSQAGLLTSTDLPGLIASQALFYARRIPDHLAGPFVEVATVFGRSKALSISATLGAVAATLVVLLGLLKAARDHRLRSAGLIPLATLVLLLAWPFTEAGRFLVPLVPFLLIGAVEGLSPIGRTWAAWLMLVLALPYSAYSALPSRVEARRQTNADFDAACRWLAEHAHDGAVVLTRHPGEVFWQTGLKAIVPDDEPSAIAEQVQMYHVGYLMVDDERYANAPASPLGLYAVEAGERVRKVYDRGVVIDEVTWPAPRR